MSDRLLSVEKAVQEFSPEELGQFAVWFADFQDQMWERQIERDSEHGRLDHLVEKARRDFAAGLGKEL